MATQGTYSLEVYRGDSKVWRIRVTDYDKATDTTTPTDLTDIQITGQMRGAANDYDVWMDLNIVKDAPKDGRFSIIMSADETAALSDPYDPSALYSGVYDIQFKKGAEVWTPIVGSVTVTGDVTREG